MTGTRDAEDRAFSNLTCCRSESPMSVVNRSVVDQRHFAQRGRAPRVRGSMIIGCTVGLAALVGVVAWWSSAPSSPGSAPGHLAAALAQLSGLVASVLICVQLLLISRVPWLVKIIGLGPMVRWHRPVGSAVLILVLAHVVLV